MGSVYLIKVHNSVFFEIDLSESIQLHTKELQSIINFKIGIYKEYSSKYAYKIKKALYKKYRIFSKGGNFFDLPKNITDNFIEECRRLEEKFRKMDKNNL